MRDEGLDQIAAGPAEGFRAAEVCGVSLNESRIEVVLADQQAELIPQPGLTIRRTVSGLLFSELPVTIRGIRRLWRTLLTLRRSTVRCHRPCAKLDLRPGSPRRASQRRGQAKIHSKDRHRRSRRTLVESRGLVNCCPEDPAAHRLVAGFEHLLNFNTDTASARSQTQESSVCDIPTAIQIDEIPQSQGESKPHRHLAQTVKRNTSQLPQVRALSYPHVFANQNCQSTIHLRSEGALRGSIVHLC